MKAANEKFLSTLQNVLGTCNSNNDEEEEIANVYFVFNGDIDHQE